MNYSGSDPPEDDDVVLDYSKRIVIDPPLTCHARCKNAQDRWERCGRPARIGRIWPEDDNYMLMPHCDDCDAEYERAYAGRQAPPE